MVCVSLNIGDWLIVVCRTLTWFDRFCDLTKLFRIWQCNESVELNCLNSFIFDVKSRSCWEKTIIQTSTPHLDENECLILRDLSIIFSPKILNSKSISSIPFSTNCHSTIIQSPAVSWIVTQLLSDNQSINNHSDVRKIKDCLWAVKVIL
jgi:hypothetical protein